MLGFLFLNAFHCMINQSERLTRCKQQGIAISCQKDGSIAPLEQHCAQPFLKQTNLTAYSARREMQFVSGSHEILKPRGSFKYEKRIQWWAFHC